MRFYCKSSESEIEACYNDDRLESLCHYPVVLVFGQAGAGLGVPGKLSILGLMCGLW